MPSQNYYERISVGILFAWAMLHLAWAVVMFGEYPPFDRPIYNSILLIPSVFIGLLLLFIALRKVSIYGIGIVFFLETIAIIQAISHNIHIYEYTFVHQANADIVDVLVLINFVIVVILYVEGTTAYSDRDGWRPYSLFRH